MSLDPRVDLLVMRYDMAVLDPFRALCADWHRLAGLDMDAGIDIKNEASASHAAYVALCAERERLNALVIVNAPWGWVGGNGALHCSVTTWGALAGCIALHGWDSTLTPVTKAEGYSAMNWGTPPPDPTKEEIRGFLVLLEAMSLIGDRYTEEILTEHGLKFSSTFMGEGYFTELVANLCEIEARGDGKPSSTGGES